MKITKAQLKQIIKEELEAINENPFGGFEPTDAGPDASLTKTQSVAKGLIFSTFPDVQVEVNELESEYHQKLTVIWDEKIEPKLISMIDSTQFSEKRMNIFYEKKAAAEKSFKTGGLSSQAVAELFKRIDVMSISLTPDYKEKMKRAAKKAAATKLYNKENPIDLGPWATLAGQRGPNN